MTFDSQYSNIVYPSWAAYSYRWKALDTLLKNPLATPYLSHRNNWTELKYSQITDNYELIDGPFGNGIIRHDPSKLIDTDNKGAWLPSVVLGAEATFEIPPGLPRFEWRAYCVRYLRPKPTDEERLGLRKYKNDPMPYFSVESCPGLDQSALICLGVSGNTRLTPDFKEFPLWLRTWEIKAEWLADEVPPCAAVVEKFLNKWNLKGVWYFAGPVGYDAGLFLAMLVYLGGFFRSRTARLKSVHLITTLPTETRMSEKWTMQQLR